MGPSWLVDVLAGVMLLTAAYCVGRIAAAALWARATHVDVDVAHVAMGVAMAGMFVPSLRSLPAPVFEAAFGVMAVVFALQVTNFVRRRGLRDWDEDHLHHVSHYATHLAMAVAMVYMLAILPAGTDGTAGTDTMAAMTSSDRPGSGLPFLLAFVLLVAAVWYADSLTRFTRKRPVAIASGDEEPLVLQPAGQVAGEAVAVRARPRLAATTVLNARDSRWLAPRLEVTTHIVMCFAMGYMLIVMR